LKQKEPKNSRTNDAPTLIPTHARHSFRPAHAFYDLPFS